MPGLPPIGDLLQPYTDFPVNCQTDGAMAQGMAGISGGWNNPGLPLQRIPRYHIKRVGHRLLFFAQNQVGRLPAQVFKIGGNNRNAFP